MPTITPDPIMKIAMGFMAAKYLFVASELGLFEALASGPSTLEELAKRVAAPVLGKSLRLSNKQSSRKSGRIGMSLNGPVWRRYGQGGQRPEPPPERFGHDRPVRLRVTPVNTEPPI